MKDWKEEARALLVGLSHYPADYDSPPAYDDVDRSAAALSAAYEQGVEDAAKVADAIADETILSDRPDELITKSLNRTASISAARVAATVRALKSAAKEPTNERS